MAQPSLPRSSHRRALQAAAAVHGSDLDTAALADGRVGTGDGQRGVEVGRVRIPVEATTSGHSSVHGDDRGFDAGAALESQQPRWPLWWRGGHG